VARAQCSSTVSYHSSVVEGHFLQQPGHSLDVSSQRMPKHLNKRIGRGKEIIAEAIMERIETAEKKKSEDLIGKED
jgi:hypothetical protein